MRNLLTFLASVLVAIVLWLNVQPLYDPDKEKELPVKLELRGLKPEFVAVQFPENINVVASGVATDIDSITTEDFSAVIDLANAQPGAREYPVLVSGPSRAGLIVRPSRTRHRIEIARLASDTRTVEMEATGLPPREFVYDGATMVPAEVTVSGADVLLKRVAKVRVLFDLGRIRPKGEYSLSVETLDDQGKPVPGIRVEPATIMVSPAVAAAPLTKRLLVTPTFTGQPAFGYRVIRYELRPGQIEVSGPNSELAKAASLETEPINIEGLQANTELSANVLLPTGLTGVGKVRVFLVIQPVSPGPTP